MHIQETYRYRFSSTFQTWSSLLEGSREVSTTVEKLQMRVYGKLIGKNRGSRRRSWKHTLTDHTTRLRPFVHLPPRTLYPGWKATHWLLSRCTATANALKNFYQSLCKTTNSTEINLHDMSKRRIQLIILFNRNEKLLYYKSQFAIVICYYMFAGKIHVLSIEILISNNNWLIWISQFKFWNIM